MPKGGEVGGDPRRHATCATCYRIRNGSPPTDLPTGESEWCCRCGERGAVYYGPKPLTGRCEGRHPFRGR